MNYSSATNALHCSPRAALIRLPVHFPSFLMQIGSTEQHISETLFSFFRLSSVTFCRVHQRLGEAETPFFCRLEAVTNAYFLVRKRLHLKHLSVEEVIRINCGGDGEAVGGRLPE